MRWVVVSLSEVGKGLNAADVAGEMQIICTKVFRVRDRMGCVFKIAKAYIVRENL